MEQDIVGILEDAGYVPVVGMENVQRMIRNAADDSTEKRCSGWCVFPDGTHCEGCGDCQPNKPLSGTEAASGSVYARKDGSQ